MISPCRPSQLHIDLSACVDNVRRLRDWVGDLDLWPVVKADGYGHGAVPVARALTAHGVAGFCVATVSEGRELRAAGISRPILVMSGLSLASPDEAFDQVVRLSLSCAIFDAATAARLAEAAAAAAISPASVHLKIDTGMGRLGVRWTDASPLAAALDAEPMLAFDGVFSSLATADETDTSAAGHDWVIQQTKRFVAACEALRADAILPPHRTLANSAGLANHPCTWQRPLITGARPGLAIYGASLNPEQDELLLRPAMSLRTRVSALRTLPPDTPVGYGMATRTSRTARLGILPLGYHDGLPRALGDRAQVWVRGHRAPLFGRISMDISIVDLTDVPGASVGDDVVVFGDAPDRAPAHGFLAGLRAAVAATGDEDGRATVSGERNVPPSVEEQARLASSIPHEILARMGARLPRVYSGSSGETL